MKNRVETCMILAAGLGSRLRPLTDVIPKPAVPFFNKSSIIRVLEKAAAAGVSRAVVNLYHKADVIEALLHKAPVASEMEIICVKEKTLLGTGGGLFNASRYFEGESVLVMNSDIVVDCDLAALFRFHAGHDSPASLLIVNPPGQEDKRLVVFDEKNREIRSFRGDALPGHERGVFAGVHVVDAEYIRTLPFKVGDMRCIVRDGYAATGGARAFPAIGGFWSDIGTPGEYLDAHQRYFKYTGGHFLMEQGYRQPYPGIFIAPEVTIYQDVMFRPPVVIGAGAVIEGDCILDEHTVIGEGCRIRSRSRLERCVTLNSAEVRGEHTKEIIFG